MTWQDKAHRLIAEAAIVAWRQAGNGPGKRHRPYSIPPIASALVKALGADDEHAAKALFLVAERIPELAR